MKQKKSEKKLELSKQTVSNLNQAELDTAKGGTLGHTHHLTCTFPTRCVHD
jgi:hypothetical protein